MKFIGQIVKLSTKTGQGRRGTWTAYSGKMKDANGREYDEWISFGFDDPGLKEGDYAEIETEADGKYNKATSIKKIDKPQASSPASGNGANVPSTGVGTARDASIQYQSSRKDALAFIQLLADADALPLSGAKTAAGVAKRNEELHQILDKYTVQFYNDVASGRILESVEDAGAVELSDELPVPGEDDEADDE